MSLDMEATYENGVLKLDRPLPLQEQERVRITIHTKISRARLTYGLMGCENMDPKDVDYLVNDPENYPWESR